MRQSRVQDSDEDEDKDQRIFPLSGETGKGATTKTIDKFQISNSTIRNIET